MIAQQMECIYVLIIGVKVRVLDGFLGGKQVSNGKS